MVNAATQTSSELTQFLHLEHTGKLFLRLRDQRFRGSCEHDIVDMEGNKNALVPVYETTDVGNKSFKAILL